MFEQPEKSLAADRASRNHKKILATQKQIVFGERPRTINANPNESTVLSRALVHNSRGEEGEKVKDVGYLDKDEKPMYILAENSIVNQLVEGLVAAAILPSIAANLLIIAFGFHDDLKGTWRLACWLEVIFFAEILTQFFTAFKDLAKDSDKAEFKLKKIAINYITNKNMVSEILTFMPFSLFFAVNPLDPDF
jgi:hypothetical protein